MTDTATSRRHTARTPIQAVLLIILVIVISATLIACTAGNGNGDGNDEGDQQATAQQTRPSITLASAQWSSAEASAHLVKVLLEERLGYRVSIRFLPADEMWAAVASGEADATVSAWLPVTHATYAEEYQGSVVDLGANLEGVRTGLVIPRVSVGRQTDATGKRVDPYIPVDSIPELAQYAEQFDGRIVGIEATAGIMEGARQALETYGLEDRFRLVEGSESEMIAALERAIRGQSWIVVTGWTPHWAFGQWDLAFLDDPENVFGSEERIHTVVAQGLADEHPDAYALLDRFHWSLEDIEQVMLWIHRDDGVDPYAKAKRWVRTHPEQVDAWLPERQQ